MKEVHVAEPLRRDSKLISAIERATEILASEIGPKSSLVTADWRPIQDARGRRLVELEISDWSGSARILFTEQDLTSMSESILGLTMVRLWGDLLQEQSHRQMSRLRQMVFELDAD